LRRIDGMISQISVHPPAIHSLTPTVVEKPSFKRKSNEEQFKQNAKVYSKLQEAEGHVNSENLAAAKQSIMEGIYFRAISFLRMGITGLSGVCLHRIHVYALCKFSRLATRVLYMYMYSSNQLFRTDGNVLGMCPLNFNKHITVCIFNTSLVLQPTRFRRYSSISGFYYMFFSKGLGQEATETGSVGRRFGAGVACRRRVRV